MLFRSYSLFITMNACCLGRVLFAKFLLDFPIMEWMRQVFCPVLLTLIISSALGSTVILFFEMGFIRLVLTSVATGCVSSLFGWCCFFGPSERDYVLNGSRGLAFKFIGLVKN